jgi:hypothetical protein
MMNAMSHGDFIRPFLNYASESNASAAGFAHMALRRAQGGQRTVTRGRTLSRQLRAEVLIAAIMVTRSVTMGKPGTQIALYGCGSDNRLIAAAASEYEPRTAVPASESGSLHALSLSKGVARVEAGLDLR